MTQRPGEKSDKQEGASGILEPAQEIWLAGVGAFAKAQEEGGKVFQSLVRKGREVVEARRRQGGAAEERPGPGREEVKERSVVGWDRFEQLLEGRLSEALDRLGVPRRSDLEALSRRVDELEETLSALREEKAASAGKRGTGAGSRTESKPGDDVR